MISWSKIVFGFFLALIFTRPYVSSWLWPRLEYDYSLLLTATAGLLAWLNKPRLRFPAFSYSFFFVLFLAVFLVSGLTSHCPENTWALLPRFTAAFLVFLAVSGLTAPRRRILVAGMVLVAAMVSLHSLLWLHLGAPAVLEQLKPAIVNDPNTLDWLSRNRAAFPFILPAALGGYLILLLPLSLALFKEYYRDLDLRFFKRPLTNSLLLVPVVLISAALFATKSLGAFFALTLAVAVYGRIKRQRLVLFIAMLGILICALLIQRSLSFGYWQNPVFSLGQRQLYWINTLTVIRFAPWTGVGPGNLPFVGSFFSHNSFLQVWAEMGIFGFACLLAFGFFSLRDSFTRAKTGPVLQGACGAGILAFLMHNLLDFTFFLPEVGLHWWILLGLAAGLARERNLLNSLAK